MAKTMQYTNHSISDGTWYEPELSDFKDQWLTDEVQDLGNNIIWWEESFGGVIWRVLKKCAQLGNPHNEDRE
ncbi:unnamed protein product [Prunus armeniaca]